MPFDDSIPHGTLKGVRQHVFAAAEVPRLFQPSEPLDIKGAWRGRP